MPITLQTSSSDVKVSGATGTVCPQSAPYKCNTHVQLIVIVRKGEKFPMCPVDRGHSTVWSVVKEG